MLFRSLIVEGVLSRTAKHVACAKYQAAGSGYSVRYFLEDGRSLPAMDAGKDKVSIVPATPLDELMGR